MLAPQESVIHLHYLGTKIRLANCSCCPRHNFMFALLLPLYYYTTILITKCSSCPSGFYKSLSSNDACNACPLGTYAPTPGSSSCVACAAGKTTVARGSTVSAQCVCAAGHEASGIREHILYVQYIRKRNQILCTYEVSCTNSQKYSKILCKILKSNQTYSLQ